MAASPVRKQIGSVDNHCSFVLRTCCAFTVINEHPFRCPVYLSFHTPYQSKSNRLLPTHPSDGIFFTDPLYFVIIMHYFSHHSSLRCLHWPRSLFFTIHFCVVSLYSQSFLFFTPVISMHAHSRRWFLCSSFPSFLLLVLFKRIGSSTFMKAIPYFLACVLT